MASDLRRWQSERMTNIPVPVKRVASDPPVPTRSEQAPEVRRPAHGVSVEEMGAASFPASDPPATWTWDPK